MKKLTAVVTGGTRGIGLAIAESLMKRNASLAITYKGEDKDAVEARRHLERFLNEKQRILTLKGEDAGIFALWTEEKRAMLKEKIFVPRLGNSLDVVRAFEYLLDSPFVTGVTLDVNGGAFMI